MQILSPFHNPFVSDTLEISPFQEQRFETKSVGFTKTLKKGTSNIIPFVADFLWDAYH